MFESKADYKVLKEVFANESKTLTEDQYSKNINKLKELAGERSAFNQERHKPRKLKARIYHVELPRPKERGFLFHWKQP